MNVLECLSEYEPDPRRRLITHRVALAFLQHALRQAVIEHQSAKHRQMEQRLKTTRARKFRVTHAYHHLLSFHFHLPQGIFVNRA